MLADHAPIKKIVVFGSSCLDSTSIVPEDIETKFRNDALNIMAKELPDLNEARLNAAFQKAFKGKIVLDDSKFTGGGHNENPGGGGYNVAETSSQWHRILAYVLMLRS